MDLKGSATIQAFNNNATVLSHASTMENVKKTKARQPNLLLQH